MATFLPDRAKALWHSERVRTAREFVADFIRTYERNDLLTRASAISYQTLFALIPAALAGLAFLGFFGFQRYWDDDLAPALEDEIGSDAFALIDEAVQRVLGAEQGFWITAGLAFALWQVSGAMRATGGGLDNIYDVSGDRPLPLRIARSVGLAAAVMLLYGLAILGLFVGPELLDVVGVGLPAVLAIPVTRYVMPVVLVLLAMALIVRFSTAQSPPYRWIGVAALVTGLAWVVATLAFRWYAIAIASYESMFGGLASVIVLMTYLYISSNVFLGGFQLDAMVRRRLGRRAAGDAE